ncbi:MAG: hypothetical protein K2X39_09235 [Silvanigrellaceae bacterium]|nr:hypothetical protein [Silvanigrellaceae bacterium]
MPTKNMLYKNYKKNILLAIFSFLGLISCSTSERSDFDIGFLDKTFGTKISIVFKIQESANNNTSIPVEYVQIYANAIFDKIKKYNTGEWFLIKDETLELKNSSELNILNWQFVPNESQQKYIVRVDSKVIAALLFVRYNNQASPPIKLHPFKDVIVCFEKNNFEINQKK